MCRERPKPTVSSPSEETTAPKSLSEGPCADVGEGTTSFNRLADGEAVKLVVFQTVATREGPSSTREGGVPADDTIPKEFFLFGRSWAIQDGLRPEANGGWGRAGGGATCSWSSSLDARTSLSGVGRRICSFDLSNGEPPTVRLVLNGDAILSEK